MTLNDCLKRRPIVEYLSSLSFKCNGTAYTINVGETFNQLKVHSIVRYKECNVTRKGVICQCSCGEFIGPCRIQGLVNGDLISCGCYQRSLHSDLLKIANYKHGDSERNNRFKLYIIWAAMLDRATNQNRVDSQYYAGKGITVCDEWRDYTVFKEWALNNGYKEGLSIDRIENSKGYEPSNCHWIELKLQNSNKTSNRYITYNGETKTITEWGRIYGLSWSVLNRRLNKGLPLDEVFNNSSN